MYLKRRQILKLFPVMALPCAVYAELLLPTPSQTSGPFYPDKLPLDRNNDLIIVNDSITPAIGQILHLSGTITNVKGEALNNALIEIWQTDTHGRYIHSDDFQENKNDPNFQGFGQFLTDSKGRYRFRTIRPVSYGSGFGKRTPHIHFKVVASNHRALVSQLYFADEDNTNDGLFSRLSMAQQKALTVLPETFEESTIIQQKVQFNIILG